MSEEQLKELQEYNLEYLEAQASEEMFGGDFTSAVELKQAKREIERLNNIIKTKDEGIKALTDDLCEESTKIEKAIDYINKRKQEREKVSKYAYDIRNDDFIKYCNIELDILKGDDK